MRRCGLCRERAATHVVVSYVGAVRVARAPLTACRLCAESVALENAETDVLLSSTLDVAPSPRSAWRAEPLS